MDGDTFRAGGSLCDPDVPSCRKADEVGGLSRGSVAWNNKSTERTCKGFMYQLYTGICQTSLFIRVLLLSLKQFNVLYLFHYVAVCGSLNLILENVDFQDPRWLWFMLSGGILPSNYVRNFLVHLLTATTWRPWCESHKENSKSSSLSAF